MTRKTTAYTRRRAQGTIRPLSDGITMTRMHNTRLSQAEYNRIMDPCRAACAARSHFEGRQMNTAEQLARRLNSIFISEMIQAVEATKIANELRRLNAENEELRADRDSWLEQCSQRVADWHSEHVKVQELEAEVKRFRQDALNEKAARQALEAVQPQPAQQHTNPAPDQRKCPMQPTCEALARAVMLEQGGTS
jgi:hypothetical protein